MAYEIADFWTGCGQGMGNGMSHALRRDRMVFHVHKACVKTLYHRFITRSSRRWQLAQQIVAVSLRLVKDGGVDRAGFNEGNMDLLGPQFDTQGIG